MNSPSSASTTMRSPGASSSTCATLTKLGMGESPDVELGDRVVCLLRIFVRPVGQAVSTGLQHLKREQGALHADRGQRDAEHIQDRVPVKLADLVERLADQRVV